MTKQKIVERLVEIMNRLPEDKVREIYNFVEFISQRDDNKYLPKQETEKPSTLKENTQWIYFNDKQNTLRYILGEKGNKTIACIGVNPSTATPEKLDPTLKKVKTVANHNGFDGWLMYNLYPQRATDPNDLDQEINYNNKILNNHTIVESVKNLRIDTIWVAWGDLIKERNYLFYCLKDIYEKLKDENISWKIVGIPTISGNPRHPLYQKSESVFYDFDMKNYIKNVVDKNLKGKKYDSITINGTEFK